MSWLKLNTPTIYLLVLAIIVLTLASIYFYIDYRLKIQTQKINSVASLASTIAEELHNIKVVLSISPDILNSVASQEKSHNEEIHDGPRNITLIDVSDDDDTIDDSDTHSSSSSDEAGSDDDADTDSDTEEPKYGGSIVINECKDNDENMVILEKIFVKIDEEPIQVNDAVESDENTKIIQCSDFNDMEKNNVEELVNDTPSINANNSDCLMVETDVDYSKMPISKLRSIAVEIGIVSDATKLKKNELLQLLTSKI